MKPLHPILLFIFIISGLSLCAQEWVQIGEDIPGEAAGDESGNAIDVSANGNIVAIGAWQNDGGGDNAGHVRIYENKDGSWTQIGDDIDGMDGEKKGFAVSLNDSGNIVALSTPYVNSNTGKVSIYKYTNGNWFQLGSDIYGIGDYYYSGVSIDLSPDGSLIAISNHANTGTIRLYKLTIDEWELVSEIKGRHYNEQLGGTGIMFNRDGTILAVRSNIKKFVRVYINLNDTVWEQFGDTIPGVNSSFSLSKDSLTVAIGDGNWFGTVKSYHFKDSAWTQKGNDIGGWFTATGFGGGVLINSTGTMIMASAVGQNFSTGLVKTYEFKDGQWQNKENDLVGRDQYDFFGTKMCISANDSVLAISAPKNDASGEDAGHVRVFKYLFPPVNVEMDTSICENLLPYKFGTQSLNSKGTFVEVFKTINNADSIVTLNLTINEQPTPTFSVDGDTLTSDSTFTSYQWFDQDGLIDGAIHNKFIIENKGSYSLQVVDANGCFGMSNEIQVGKTGINKLEQSKQPFVIFPNPVSGMVKVRFFIDKEENITVSVINLLGQDQLLLLNQILIRGEYELQFDISGIASGIYFMQMDKTGSSSALKLVVE